MNEGPFDNNGQLVISYELILFFRWMFEYEQENLKKFMSRALRNGFDKTLVKKIKKAQAQSHDEMQYTIIDFFALMEIILCESMHEHNIKNSSHDALYSVIDTLDLTNCDNHTVATSFDKAISICANKPEEDAKKVLCKELLRRWKPSKKLTIN